jgi:chromosome segregation ATPase
MDNTMASRKKQEYDKFAISRAIDQVSDPALRGFLEAVTDVVTGITGNAQVTDIEERQALRDEIAGLRKQLGAEKNDRATIAQHLEREGKKTDRILALGEENQREIKKLSQTTADLQTGQAALTETLGGVVSQVQDLSESVNELDGRMDTAEHRLDSFERQVNTRFAQVEGKVDNLADEVQQVKAQTSAMQRILEAFPPPVEIQERMDNS